MLFSQLCNIFGVENTVVLGYMQHFSRGVSYFFVRGGYLLGPVAFVSVIVHVYTSITSAGIFKQSMGARNRVGLSYVPARQATQPGGVGSLEAILGLLKSLKIRQSFLHERTVQ